jgi:hypothetical protein
MWPKNEHLSSRISLIIGFLCLFLLYHFPEFFSAFWLMVLFKLLFLVVAYLIARLQGRQSWERYGLGRVKLWWQRLVMGGLLGIGCFLASWIASMQCHYEAIVSVKAGSSMLQQLPTLLLLTLIPSLAEDILTRGYWYTPLSCLKPGVWVVFSATLFVGNHIWRLSDGAAVIAYLFLLGLVLALAVRVTGSLWLAFGIHWGANLAFESVRAFITTTPLVAHAGSTWLLAACWGLLLAIMVFVLQMPRIRGILCWKWA